MNQQSTTQVDALILAIDESGQAIGAELRNRFASDWPMLLIHHAGEALRHAHACRPKAMFICVGTEQVETTATVIAALVERCRHQTQAMVALAAAHEEQIERAVRIAGATHYFTLDSDIDGRQLNQVIAELGIARAEARCGLSPPKSRASPAALSPRHRRPSLQ